VRSRAVINGTSAPLLVYLFLTGLIDRRSPLLESTCMDDKKDMTDLWESIPKILVARMRSQPPARGTSRPTHNGRSAAGQSLGGSHHE